MCNIERGFKMITNIEIIQEFSNPDFGIRGIYKFMFEDEFRVVARKDNDLYAISHLYNKPELMKVRSDVVSSFMAELEKHKKGE